MTEYIKNQLIKLCDNPEWFNDMLNTWDFKPERESQAIKEYLSNVLLNGKLENTHIERIEMGGRMVSFEVPGHTKDYTEGFTEEMVIPYRTEELNPYLRYPHQEINKIIFTQNS